MKNSISNLSLGILFVIAISLACNRKTEKIAVSSDGVQISYEVQGKGKPALVFVHGWTNPKSIWDDQMTHFSQKYKVVALDLAGSGKSGNNRSEWTIQAFGNDVASVVKKLKLNEVILIGFSMGAPVVIEAEKLLPEKVNGIILVDGLNDPDIQFPPEMISVMDSMMMDLVTNMNNEKFVALGFYKNNPDSTFKRLSCMYDGLSHIGWHESLLGYFKWMNEDQVVSLKMMKVPVTAVNSDLEPTNVEAFLKYIPGFQAKIMTGVGHLLFWDNPQEFNRLLDESIQEFMSK